jgi:hypothetical protein
MTAIVAACGGECRAAGGGVLVVAHRYRRSGGGDSGVLSVDAVAVAALGVSIGGSILLTFG